MTTELFIRYLHFISIITVAGALVSEHMLLRSSLQRRDIKRLWRIDGVFGAAALIILATGLAMWLWVGKSAEYYTTNGLMHIKTTIFIIIGVLSIMPSIFFFKNRKGNEEDIVDVPKKIFWYIRFEILLLFIMPYLAVLIARGIGI